MNYHRLIDALIVSSFVQLFWILFRLMYRAGKLDYEKDRNRREAVRKHYIEHHDRKLRECEYNLCATLV